MEQNCFEPKTKEIDGITVMVAPFPAIVALRLKATLMKVFGPALGQALGAVEGLDRASMSILDTKINGDNLGKAIEHLFQSLPENEFVALVERILQGTICTVAGPGGKKSYRMDENFDQSFSMVFTGKLFSMYKVIYFILEVNYPDFFGVVVKGFGSRLKAFTSNLPIKSKGESGTE